MKILYFFIKNFAFLLSISFAFEIKDSLCIIVLSICNDDTNEKIGDLQ
jgi:hypothetical protein